MSRRAPLGATRLPHAAAGPAATTVIAAPTATRIRMSRTRRICLSLRCRRVRRARRRFRFPLLASCDPDPAPARVACPLERELGPLEELRRVERVARVSGPPGPEAFLVPTGAVHGHPDALDREHGAELGGFLEDQAQAGGADAAARVRFAQGLAHDFRLLDEAQRRLVLVVDLHQHHGEWLELAARRRNALFERDAEVAPVEETGLLVDKSIVRDPPRVVARHGE